LEEVAEIRARLRRTLSDAVGAAGFGQPVTFHANSDGPLELQVFRLTAPGAKPAQWGWWHHSATVAGAVMHAVATLITQVGDRLIACRLCGAAIVATRKQQYCTEGEAQKARDQRKAARKPGVTPKLTPKRPDMSVKTGHQRTATGRKPA